MLTFILTELCVLTLAWLMFMNGYFIASSIFVGLATLGILILAHNKRGA